MQCINVGKGKDNDKNRNKKRINEITANIAELSELNAKTAMAISIQYASYNDRLAQELISIMAERSDRIAKELNDLRIALAITDLF